MPATVDRTVSTSRQRLERGRRLPSSAAACASACSVPRTQIEAANTGPLTAGDGDAVKDPASPPTFNLPLERREHKRRSVAGAVLPMDSLLHALVDDERLRARGALELRRPLLPLGV